MDAIIAAVRLGDAASLAHLLDKERALVNSPDITGEHAIHVAARLQGPQGVDCIETLVKYKAKVNVRDAKGRTPMHHAATFGRISALMALVRHGGRLDAFDSSGHTPIDSLLHVFEYPTKRSDRMLEVHTWGKGANLELGHGDMDNRIAPKKVMRLAGMEIAKKNGICCSKNHTIVCTTKGEAYSWGIGTGGRLGQGDEVHKLAPVLLPVNKVVFVACSVSHSGFITGDGHMFTCGANEFGQLGLGDVEPRFTPKRVRWREEPADAIVALALSPSHSVALTSKGHVWTWGNDNEGQLGIGPAQKKFQTEPKLIPLFAGTISLSASAPLYAVNIAAGQGCTVISTSVHDIAIFGANRQSPARFVLEHPRTYISNISVSSSGARGVAVTETGHVFEWHPNAETPAPSKTVFPLLAGSSFMSSSSSSLPRLVVRTAVTTDNHIVLSTESGSVYHYEYPSTPLPMSSSTPPSTQACVPGLRRIPIQRASSVATSDSHSVVAALACVPAELIELDPSTLSSDFAALAGSMLFSDMSFATSDGQVVPAHRIIASRMPDLRDIKYGASIAIEAPQSIVTTFLSQLYSSSPVDFVEPEVGKLLAEWNVEKWVPLELHLSRCLVDGRYADMVLSTSVDEYHPENATTYTLHRVVMAARCDYFLAMSTSGMREAVPISPISMEESAEWAEGDGTKLTTSLDISSNLFELIVNFIYTDAINKLETHAKSKKEKQREKTNAKQNTPSVNFWLELLAAADQLMIPQLKVIAANNLLPLVRVDTVGSIIAVAIELDPYDTRLQDACIDYIKNNLDIMLVARALEDVPPPILALIDEKVNPFSEDDMAAQLAAKKIKKKATGLDSLSSSFQATSVDETFLPSPSPSSFKSPLPSPRTTSDSLTKDSKPSPSSYPSETPPHTKTMKKRMKQQQKQQQELMLKEHQSDEPVQNSPISHIQPSTPTPSTPPTQILDLQVMQSSPISQIPSALPGSGKKKKEKQAMKRIVGFDPVLIAQALEETKPHKEEPPAKPAWSVEAKAPASQPVSLLAIQKQQTHVPSPAKHSKATEVRASEKFSSAISLEQFLAPTKEKKKEKEKEKEKPFSWGGSALDTPEQPQLVPKPKIDLSALAAEEQAAKNQRREPKPKPQIPKPPPPTTPQVTREPVTKPKLDMAAYINAEQTAKDQRTKALNRPPKPIAIIETEERALQQITRLYTEFPPGASQFVFGSPTDTPIPSTNKNTTNKNANATNKNANNTNKNANTNNTNSNATNKNFNTKNANPKRTRRKTDECDTRPMDIKFAST